MKREHLTDPKSIKAVLKSFSRSARVCLDTETTGLQWYKPTFRPFYISITDGKRAVGFREPERYKEDLQRMLDAVPLHIYYNAKFDLHALQNIGIMDRGVIHDTMFLARLIDDRNPFNLSWQTEHYLPEEERKLSGSIEDWFKENKIKKADRDFSLIPTRILAPYAIQDVISTLALYDKHIATLQALDARDPMDEVPGIKRGLMAVFELECQAIRPIQRIERAGYCINPEHFQALSPELHGHAQEKRKEIASTLKREYGFVLPDSCNLASPDDMRDLFLDVLNIDPDDLSYIDKQGESKLSLAAWILEKLDNPVANLILEYRESEKLAGTFGTGILDFTGSDGRIHADYQQVRAATGRMSCTEPNMQNFPRVDSGDEDAFANKIRQGFIAPPGYTLVYFDYSQLELRIFAYYSQDAILLDAIRTGKDLHTETAKKIFKTDTPTKEQRQKAKTTNFATVYGGGKRTLAKQLGIPIPNADMFRTEYLHHFPSIKAFFSLAEEVVKERGYIRTFWGRRRQISADKSYTAPNTVVQGTATGDLHKAGLIAVDEYLCRTGAGYIVNPVHDELGCCIKSDCVHEVVPVVKRLMESYENLFSLPLVVDVEWSDTNWGSKKKYKSLDGKNTQVI